MRRVFIFFVFFVCCLSFSSFSDSTEQKDWYPDPENCPDAHFKLIEVEMYALNNDDFKQVVSYVQNHLALYRQVCPHPQSAIAYKKFFAAKMVKSLSDRNGKIQNEISRAADYRYPDFEINNLKENWNLMREYSSYLPMPRAVLRPELLDFEKEIRIAGDKKSFERQKSCSPVDLRQTYPVLKEMRDQDTVGWCGFFTFADIMSVQTGTVVSVLDVTSSFYFSNNPKVKEIQQKIVKADLLIKKKISLFEYLFSSDQDLLNKTSPKDFTNYGVYSLDQGIPEAVLEKGLCSEKDLPFHLAGATQQGYVSELSSVFTRDCDNCANQDIAKLSQNLTKLFPYLFEKQIEMIIRKTSGRERLKKLVDENCKGRRFYPVKKIKIIRRDILTEKQYAQAIDEQLNNKNMVAIDYNSSVLIDRDLGLQGKHSSSVIGRRFDEKTKQCQYLVKNSWGRDCQKYEFTQNCEEGNIWMAEEDLNRSIHGIEYVQ